MVKKINQNSLEISVTGQRFRGGHSDPCLIDPAEVCRYRFITEATEVAHDEGGPQDNLSPHTEPGNHKRTEQNRDEIREDEKSTTMTPEIRG